MVRLIAENRCCDGTEIYWEAKGRCGFESSGEAAFVRAVWKY